VVTTFISVSLKRECSLRLAEPMVSQRSSTIPTLAWTYSEWLSVPLRQWIVTGSSRPSPPSASINLPS